MLGYRWGEPFLEHTFLYHIHRLDHRHNFSPYFYSFYLSTSSNLPSVPWSSFIRHPLAAFLPQLGLSIALGFAFGAKDLAFAWLVQTLTFVTFNKVCTSQVSSSGLSRRLARPRADLFLTVQYFLWYLWFLPPVLPNLHISGRRGLFLIAAWILSQVRRVCSPFSLNDHVLTPLRFAFLSKLLPTPRYHLLAANLASPFTQALWLSQAFQLEMLAQPVYLRVWASGVVFFGVNCWVIVEIVRGYRSADVADATKDQQEDIASAEGRRMRAKAE